MDSRTPTPMLHVAAAIVIGIFMALFLGQAAAQGSFSKIGMILALGPLLFIILGLQGNVWLIIPFASTFYGTIPFLPLPFAVSEVAKMAAFGVFVFLAVFKKLPSRASFEFVDLLLVLNLIYLATVFMRNPVGVNAIGSDRVGGRPYFMVIIAFMLYWVYLHISVGPKLAWYLPFIGLAGGFVALMIWAVSRYVPGTAPIMAKFYTGVDFGTLLSEYREGPTSEETITRLTAVANFGFSSIMILVAYNLPLALFSPIHFWRFVAFCASAMAMLMGGFRTKLYTFGLYFLLICYVRGGLFDMFRATFLGAAGIILIVAAQLSGLIPLPLAIQRTLSALPLPVKWDSAVVSDAEGSSQWRYTMWHEVLTEDKWIKSKLLGDGFGFTREELRIMQSDLLGTGGFMGTDGAEAQKITGAYHSGPLSAIRFVGVVGLLFYLALAFELSRKTWQLMRRTLKSPYQPWSLLQVGTVFAPYLYIFVFGGYDSSLPATIGSLAGYKLLSRSFKDYQTSLKAKEEIEEMPADELQPALTQAGTPA